MGLLLVSLALAAPLALSVSCPAFAKSDWVEEGLTEFRAQPGPANAARDDRRGQGTDNSAPTGRINDQNNSEETYEQPRAKRSPIERHAHDTYIPPPGTAVGDVSDAGGIELGPNGQPRKTIVPLEARITTNETTSDYRAPGIDRRAANLLMQAPMYAIPRTVAVSPKSFRVWLDETHPGLAQKITREEIIEVKGQWDDSAHALRNFGLPFTRVTGQKFAEVNLDKARVVIVNCAGELPNEALLSLRRYVAMGGALVTTDWALSGVLQKAFPGFVEWNGGFTANRVVDAVEVDKDQADLLANTPPVAHWKLDNKSQTVKVNRPGPVRVLVRSRMLMREDPSGLGVLAFTLDYGNGQILHLVGHFDNNSELAFNNALPDPAPGIDISLRQAITANFLAKALSRGREEGGETQADESQPPINKKEQRTRAQK